MAIASSSKTQYTKAQLEELLDSIPELANDLTTVIDTYATKAELTASIPNITFTEVTEISDITPY
nr:MAG TPA: hypothetical protein [Crassvirales sp.]